MTWCQINLVHVSGLLNDCHGNQSTITTLTVPCHFLSVLAFRESLFHLACNLCHCFQGTNFTNPTFSFNILISMGQTKAFILVYLCCFYVFTFAFIHVCCFPICWPHFLPHAVAVVLFAAVQYWLLFFLLFLLICFCFHPPPPSVCVRFTCSFVCLYIRAHLFLVLNIK